MSTESDSTNEDIEEYDYTNNINNNINEDDISVDSDDYYHIQNINLKMLNYDRTDIKFNKIIHIVIWVLKYLSILDIIIEEDITYILINHFNLLGNKKNKIKTIESFYKDKLLNYNNLLSINPNYKHDNIFMFDTDTIYIISELIYDIIDNVIYKYHTKKKFDKYLYYNEVSYKDYSINYKINEPSLKKINEEDDINFIINSLYITK